MTDQAGAFDGLRTEQCDIDLGGQAQHLARHEGLEASAGGERRGAGAAGQVRAGGPTVLGQTGDQRGVDVEMRVRRCRRRQ
ncbi:hypothetical protein ACWCQQ_47960 [Streptomyces sp. NPDC002143]